MTTPATVFVVDADGATREALRTLAHTMNLECETYASGREFLADFDPDRPGCLVMEIRIPDVNGVQIQEQLKELGSTLPILFLTGQATVSIAVRAMRAGALHVLEKPFREHELWDAIAEAVELDRELRSTARQRHEMEERVAQLDAKEQTLLRMLAQGRAAKEMAAELGVCTRTVEIRRSQVMKKLGMHNLIELIQFALTAVDAGHLVEENEDSCFR